MKLGYADLDLGTIEAVFNKLGGIEGARAFLRDEQKLVFPFERNSHGHVIITVIGLDLTGAEEIKQLKAAGCRVSDYATSCLTSTKKDGYDAAHKLANQQYKIALVPGKEITRNTDRTTEALRKLGLEYGYQKPLAGIVPRIRESVSNKQMEEMRFYYIAALHDPIGDSGGRPSVLRAIRRSDGPWLYAYWGEPQDEWDDRGLFAFLVPA